MKAFKSNFSYLLISAEKIILTKSMRGLLQKIPFLPPRIHGIFFDIRFTEPKVFRFLNNIIKLNWVCFDIGAHCGIVSKHLAGLVGKTGFVYSFEPIESNIAILKNQLEKAGFSNNSQIIPYAIGKTNETLHMSRGDHSTTWHFNAEPIINLDGVKVECRTLEFLALDLKKPDFIKVDIEGAEVDMICGAGFLIDIVRPIWLMEMHGPESWSICGRFLEKNYVIFDLDGLNISYQDSTANSYGHAVFCPVEKLSLLK